MNPVKTYSRKPVEKDHSIISCPVCGSEQSRALWYFEDARFVRCMGCGLVFQNPQPKQKDLVLRYDDEYFQYETGNEETFYRLMELTLADIGFDDIEKKCFSACTDEKKPVFVDVGCATGRLMMTLRQRGWRTTGVEVCRPAAEFGIKSRNLDIRVGTLEEAAFADNSVDVLHASHLIEHLCRPGTYLKEAARVLKPGGYLVTVTPNIEGFQALVFGSQWRSAIADHMFLFSARLLKLLIKKYGFKIEKSLTWGGLAAGTVPDPLKKTADFLAKKLGCGDVVCILSSI